MKPLPSRRPRGIASVELALVLVLLSVLAFTTLELGRMLYHYHVLVQSARAAARYTVKHPGSDAQAIAKCLAVYGVLRSSCGSGSDVAVLSGLTLNHVKFETKQQKLDAEDKHRINVLAVHIEAYRFNTLVPSLFTSFNFGPISVVMPNG